MCFRVRAVGLLKTWRSRFGLNSRWWLHVALHLFAYVDDGRGAANRAAYREELVSRCAFSLGSTVWLFFGNGFALVDVKRRECRRQAYHSFAITWSGRLPIGRVSLHWVGSLSVWAGTHLSWPLNDSHSMQHILYTASVLPQLVWDSQTLTRVFPWQVLVLRMRRAGLDGT